ncbi:hypothetical protein PHLCEN_2v11712 [Hermanssonia centrifuga]|uniref:Uncharacterized protein n=1 Tax=Hermanssonia centrifuga TaxID=98765 RepID=A0A2R6NJ27_9APHY|nr:hypothetical protein PHLCEN_2v11712 [Hermanssonia centrifuga]
MVRVVDETPELRCSGSYRKPPECRCTVYPPYKSSPRRLLTFNAKTQLSKASRRWFARLLAGMVWIEDLETVIKGWRVRRPMVANDGTWVRRIRALLMGHYVLAVGSSRSLYELRRNVSLYIILNLSAPLFNLWFLHEFL